MNYSVMSPAQAAGFSGFIQPYILLDPEREAFWYLSAWDEDVGLAGLVVIDPQLDQARLLSVAVSPPAQGKGVASSLIAFALSKLEEAGIPELAASSSLPQPAWPPLERLLVRNGFRLVEQEGGGTYTIPLSHLLELPLVQKAAGRSGGKQMIPLMDVSDYALRSLSNQAVRQGLFEPLRREDYHPRLSMCYLENDLIMACFLVRELAPDHLENSWTYLSGNIRNQGALLALFAASAAVAAGSYPLDTLVSFTCLNDAGEKLLRHVIPGVEPAYVQRLYVRDTAIQREEDWTPPEMALELVDDKNLYCARCVHRRESLTVCEKYHSKPGAVLYGAQCKHFQETAG